MTARKRIPAPRAGVVAARASTPAARVTGQRASIMEALPYVAWAQALIATLGSLFFSEVLLYPPCVLCWYQRIAMYPLVIVIGVAILRRDRAPYQVVLPLSVIGLAIAVYHNLLYFGVLPEAVTVCRAGISCTARYFEWFGFISIPQLSLAAFTVITALMLVQWRSQRDAS